MTSPDAVTALLETMRTEAQTRITEMGGELDAVAAASAGSNIDDEHDPEGSTIAFEREQMTALRTQAEAHLAEIDAALERVRTGQYGKCERCGEAIGAARLDALPAAPLCVDCASEAQRP